MVSPAATPQKRVLPARARRESAAKRRALESTTQKTTVTKSPVSNPNPNPEAASQPKVRGPRGPYKKKASLGYIATPSRSASTPASNTDELLPVRVINGGFLPTSLDRQSENLSKAEYQSLVDSAVLTASLHRSRMQWLCDGVLEKYWTKPTKRKGVIEQPPTNPDAKSMQKLGNGTITIEPHTFDATFYVVRDPNALAPTSTQLPSQIGKQKLQSPVVHGPLVSTIPTSSTTPTPKVSQPSSGTHTPLSNRPPTPPGGAKTTDPVIQMLAARAATDSNLKDLMKVVATSRASPAQLKEFQTHIDEFNAIVKKQDMERDRQAKLAGQNVQPPHLASHTPYGNASRNSPINPAPQFVTYPGPPRSEPLVKHIVIEFTSPTSAGGSASTDRWLFPENAVLDIKYGGMEMTCSFLVERKGSEILASLKGATDEATHAMVNKWKSSTEYFEPVTMIVKATQHRTIETIARSAKSLPDVQKYMQEVMEKKTRVPQEYLLYQLPRDKVEGGGFVDSAVELSEKEDDELKDFYPIY